jgi:hypothetical protein
MPEWMTLPDAVEPKLAVFLVLVGIILGLSYFGRRAEPPVKAGSRPVKHRKKRELSGAAR